MSSSRLLDRITEQIAELDHDDVLRLQSRVSRLAHYVRMQDPEFRRRWTAGAENARSSESGILAHSCVAGDLES